MNRQHVKHIIENIYKKALIHMIIIIINIIGDKIGMTEKINPPLKSVVYDLCFILNPSKN